MDSPLSSLSTPSVPHTLSTRMRTAAKGAYSNAFERSPGIRERRGDGLYEYSAVKKDFVKVADLRPEERATGVAAWVNRYVASEWTFMRSLYRNNAFTGPSSSWETRLKKAYGWAPIVMDKIATGVNRWIHAGLKGGVGSPIVGVLGLALKVTAAVAAVAFDIGLTGVLVGLAILAAIVVIAVAVTAFLTSPLWSPVYSFFKIRGLEEQVSQLQKQLGQSPLSPAAKRAVEQYSAAPLSDESDEDPKSLVDSRSRMPRPQLSLGDRLRVAVGRPTTAEQQFGALIATEDVPASDGGGSSGHSHLL